jgi:hypothetical protein
MTETKTEKKEWIEVPNNSGRWIPEKPGDTLIGVYLEKKPAPYKGRDNYKYILESSNPSAVDGTILVYGTDGLNSAMDKIPFQTKLKILYDGEIPSKDPVKKPFKKFKVCYYGSKGDDLYKKLYPEESQETSKTSGAEMKLKEDPEARNTIDHYIEVMKEQHLVVTCEAVILYIKSDPDFDENSEDMTRVKFELMRMFKAGEIKRAKEID